jgi:hypothetical protein
LATSFQALFKKKPVADRSPQQALPLRHIELVVIWEGNYKSDIFNIGLGARFLKRTVELFAICSHAAPDLGFLKPPALKNPPKRFIITLWK